MAESSPSRKMFAVMLDSAQQDLAAVIDYRPWRRLSKCLNGRHGRLRSLESVDQIKHVESDWLFLLQM